MPRQRKDYMDLDQYDDADWERLSQAVTHYSPRTSKSSFEVLLTWLFIIALSVLFWVVVIDLMIGW